MMNESQVNDLAKNDCNEQTRTLNSKTNTNSIVKVIRMDTMNSNNDNACISKFGNASNINLGSESTKKVQKSNPFGAQQTVQSKNAQSRNPSNTVGVSGYQKLNISRKTSLVDISRKISQVDYSIFSHAPSRSPQRLLKGNTCNDIEENILESCARNLNVEFDMIEEEID